MDRSCPLCRSSLIEIQFGELTLRSCSGCDSRWWLRADSPAGFEDVLRSFAEEPGGRRRRRMKEAS